MYDVCDVTTSQRRIIIIIAIIYDSLRKNIYTNNKGSSKRVWVLGIWVDVNFMMPWQLDDTTMYHT